MHMMRCIFGRICRNPLYAFDRYITYNECFDNPYLFCEKAANTYKRLAVKISIAQKYCGCG